MSPREEQRPQDFHKMCKQAERDQESKKLVVLMERVRRQLREREQGSAVQVEAPKPPVAVSSGFSDLPGRSFFER